MVALPSGATTLVTVPVGASGLRTALYPLGCTLHIVTDGKKAAVSVTVV